MCRFNSQPCPAPAPKMRAVPQNRNLSAPQTDLMDKNPDSAIVAKYSAITVQFANWFALELMPLTGL